MKWYFLIIFVLSSSYGAQAGMAASPVTGFLAKHLMPHRFKVAQVLSLTIGALHAKDHRWINLQSLLREDQPFGRATKEAYQYSNLRGSEQHIDNLVQHIAHASHAELDKTIALLRVNTMEVLPHFSRLTREEARDIVKKIAVFDLRNFEGIAAEDVNEVDIEAEFNTQLKILLQRAHGAVRMSADGYASVITAFQKLYAAKKFEEMHDITAEAWKKHYNRLSKNEIIDALENIMKSQNNALPARHDFTHGAIETELDTFEETIAQLDLPEASHQEAIEYLVSERVPSSTFTEVYGNADDLGDDNTFAVYKELDFISDIMVATAGLDKQEMSYLARALNKATVR